MLLYFAPGKFPLWLTPDQFAVLPISDRFNEYAADIKRRLALQDIRGFVDDRSEKIGRKIRDTELKRIPMMLIVGEKEAEEGTVSVRRQGEGDIGSMNLDEFVTYFSGLL